MSGPNKPTTRFAFSNFGTVSFRRPKPPKDIAMSGKGFSSRKDRFQQTNDARERRESDIDAVLERHGASKKPVTLATLEWQRKWLSEE